MSKQQRDVTDPPFYYPQVGDLVRTKQKFWGSRKWGTVVSIDGSYIYIKLRYKGIVIERYPVELELMKR